MKLFTTKSSKDGPVVYINNWIIAIAFLVITTLFVVTNGSIQSIQSEDKIEYKNVSCT